MRSIPTFACLLTLALTAGGEALADPPASPDPSVKVPPEVKDIIARMSADDYRIREKAGRELASLGDKSLPVLLAALKDIDDPEAARRVEVIVQKIQTSRLVAARTVTASFKNVSGKAALDEIAKQTGYRILTNGIGAATGKVTLELKETPFWEALDKVSEAAGIMPNFQDEEGTLSVYQGDAVNPHVAYCGPFKILATHISSNRSLQLSGFSRQHAGQRGHENIYMNLQIMSEPKSPIIGIGQTLIVEATDDKGNSLAPPRNNGYQRDSYYAPQIGYRSYTQGSSLNLSRSGRESSTIKEMKLKMSVTILAEARPDVIFENITKAKGKRLNGRSAEVSIREVGEANGMVTVSLTATNRHGQPNDYTWSNTVHQRLELFDEQGQKFRSFGLNEQNNGPNVASMTAQFGSDGQRKMGKPAKFQVVEWIPLTRELEFTLKDIPLP